MYVESSKNFEQSPQGLFLFLAKPTDLFIGKEVRTMARRRGHNDYGFVAEVDGRKMEFATDEEFKEYEELLEESESSFIFSQNSQSL